jgi:hypothetical protein
MNSINQEIPTTEDHEKALVEVAFLLNIFATTINDLMGGATSSISRISGRSMARKMPVYLKDADIQQILTAIAEELKGGFEISSTCNHNSAEMSFNKCAIRKICETRNIELNGPLCKLFHYYLDGIVNDLYFRPAKSMITSTGKKCQAHLELK